MKTSKRKIKSSAVPQPISDLLAEAMKQPGVKSVMDVFDAAEKYHRQSEEFTSYMDWQRYPPAFSSCETTQLA